MFFYHTDALLPSTHLTFFSCSKNSTAVNLSGVLRDCPHNLSVSLCPYSFQFTQPFSKGRFYIHFSSLFSFRSFLSSSISLVENVLIMLFLNVFALLWAILVISKLICMNLYQFLSLSLNILNFVDANFNFRADFW